MNYVDELWVYICNRVLQKTISIHQTTFCRPIDKNVCCNSIKIQGDKIKIKRAIFSYTIIDKSKFIGIDLLFKHADIGQKDKQDILRSFADNYVDSILTGMPNYDIEEDYDYHAR